MPIAPTAQVHPTALLSPEVEVGQGVQIGPYVVVEGHVQIGRECIIRPHVHLCGPLTLGEGNHIFTGAVLGERPQHLKYQGELTRLEIGNHNVFREGVTIHRGTTHSWTTRIGSHNYFMVNSHVGHDCVIGNHCLFANGALVAGHCTIEDRVYLSGNCAIHQFARVGRLALLSGCSVTTKDLPPFLIQQGINNVLGVNVVGMRRAGISNDRINAVRQAFHILFRESFLVPVALARIEKEWPEIDVITELVQFIRQSTRGINIMRDRRPEAA